MKRIRMLPLSVMALVTFLVGAATPRDQVPPVFASLVPQGCRKVSAGFTKNGAGGIVMVGVTFTAYKEYRGHHFRYDGEHSFDLTLQQKPKELMAMQGPRYRQAFPAEVESARQEFAKPGSDAITGYDSFKETTYPWGWGMTRRVLHHWMGSGSNPDDIDYEGYYLGLIVGETSVKQFKLHVFGVTSKDEVEQWAAKAVDLIQRTSAADID